MNEEQLKAISERGFDKKSTIHTISQKLNFHELGNIYRLYDKKTSNGIFAPDNAEITIVLRSRDNVQINTNKHPFNHLAAIKKMQELNLID